MEESVTVKGVTVVHNTRKWHTCTNRHPTTSGYSWGWIEGAPGNVCWGDDQRFNSKAASEMCTVHNQWLEHQKPISLRIVEAREAKDAADREYRTKLDAAKRAESVYLEKHEHLTRLVEQAQQP